MYIYMCASVNFHAHAHLKTSTHTHIHTRKHPTTFMWGLVLCWVYRIHTQLASPHTHAYTLGNTTPPSCEAFYTFANCILCTHRWLLHTLRPATIYIYICIYACEAFFLCWLYYSHTHRWLLHTLRPAAGGYKKFSKLSQTLAKNMPRHA